MGARRDERTIAPPPPCALLEVQAYYSRCYLLTAVTNECGEGVERAESEARGEGCQLSTCVQSGLDDDCLSRMIILD